MTILVTGGAGYIGSHTVRALVTQGRDVVVLDSLELGHKSRVDNVPFVEGDISDGKIIDKVCRKFDVSEVIHFAAYKAVGESMEQPLRYYNNNVAGTIALVRALMANGVEKIVFSSSAAVYGNPDHVPVTEDAPLRPESVYAETKAMVEKFLASCETIGLRSVSLRYFNAAGASADAAIGEDWSMSQNLVPLVMKALLGFSGPLNVFGNDYQTPDGTCTRDYIHVEDLAAAHIKALELSQRWRQKSGMQCWYWHCHISARSNQHRRTSEWTKGSTHYFQPASGRPSLRVCRPYIGACATWLESKSRFARHYW